MKTVQMKMLSNNATENNALPCLAINPFTFTVILFHHGKGMDSFTTKQKLLFLITFINIKYCLYNTSCIPLLLNLFIPSRNWLTHSLTCSCEGLNNMEEWRWLSVICRSWTSSCCWFWFCFESDKATNNHNHRLSLSKHLPPLLTFYNNLKQKLLSYIIPYYSSEASSWFCLPSSCHYSSKQSNRHRQAARPLK